MLSAVSEVNSSLRLLTHLKFFLFKVGDKSLINSKIGLHEVPAKLNFEGETSEVLLSFQAHFVMCLGKEGLFRS